MSDGEQLERATPAAANVSEDDDLVEDEDAKPCPICGKPVNPGAAELCPHYLCILDDEGFDWFAPDLTDFRDAVATLVSTMEELDDEDTDWLAVVPQEVRKLYKEVSASGDWNDDYWTYDPGVQEVEYATEFTLFTAYFHPEARAFARHVKAVAEDTVRWLERAANA